jgi:hypothetical protein
MFTIGILVITEIILIKMVCLFIIFNYLPFVIFKTIRGGTFNTFYLCSWSLSVATFVTVQWLV